MPDTLPGMVLGTVGYMSPEQVRGAAADSRTDVFAFGAVLHEMLSGRRAFAGNTPADVMSAILREDPPDLPIAERHIPPALARIVGRCLEKNPAARFQSTRDLAFALEALSTHSGSAVGVHGHTAPVSPARGAPPARERALRAVALLFLLTTLGLAGWMFRPAPAPTVVRFSVSPPEGVRFGAFALSPDGQQLAFVASATGDTTGESSRIYVRSLDAVSTRPLDGTERGQNPFWSSDGRAIGFFADGKLKVIDTSNGAVRTLCDAVGARTWGDWNQDGVIVFSTESTHPILRVSTESGQPVPVTTVGEGRGHVRPTFLPGGRRFLYLARSSLQATELRLASLDSKEDTVVLNPSGWARYVDPGYLVFVRGTELVAQPFDATTGALSGRAVAIGTVGAGFDSVSNVDESGFSVSGAGLLAFRTLEQETDNQLVWFSRSGERLSTLGQSGQYRNLHLSPDTSRLAVQQRDESGRSDVWLFDIARDVKTRLTLDAQDRHELPLWSPDGSSIAMKELARGVSRVSVAGGGEAELLSATPFDPNSYSPDGRFMAYTILNPQTNRDVGVMPLFGDRKPSLLLQSTANEVHGQISPDGRWIAYESDESGAYETYVQSFPTGGQKVRVSESGGLQPRWRRDGRELYFLDPAGRLLASSVQPLVAEFRVRRPEPLFQSNVVAVAGGMGTNAHYDVTPDGQRFIVASRSSGIADPPITIVLNWSEELKRLVPTR
jgi:Tol biopolymer transport system component